MDPCKACDDVLNPLICCWPKLMYGRACCVWNALFAPCILSIWSCSIFLVGCIQVYMNRSLYKFCCCVCRFLNCCWVYTDQSFPPNHRSLGKVGGDSANAESGSSDAKVKWLRAGHLTYGGKMQLFGATVDSRDICQGSLGDCWLLAAMACLAEHKGAVQSLFRTKERNPRGKYKIRLFDGVSEEWEVLTIDDFIPCSAQSEKPLFTQPNGDELWAMLLEKAFAKFCGSFANLEGGQTIWALRAMTGDPARWFERDESDSSWKRFDLRNLRDPDNKRASNLHPNDEKIPYDTMFEIIKKYDDLKSVLCASGSSGECGLHKGHAYSILEVQKVKSTRLVRIRNPWGNGEWTGAWSDKSEEWKKNGDVASAVSFQDSDDGSFWMCWDDFVKHWSRIGIVHRTVDINALRLDVKDDSMCAPTGACCRGCCRFWCLCEGARYLYFPDRSSHETVKVNKCCAIL